MTLSTKQFPETQKQEHADTKDIPPIPEKEKRAVIIGAGPAGLTAAWKLLETTDIRPVILEESEWIGGISRTAEYKGNRMDLGGHRFFSKSDTVNRMWSELMPLQGRPSLDDLELGIKKNLPGDGPDPALTDEVMLLRDRVSRIFYLRKFFDYPVSLKLETFRNMGLRLTFKAGFGYLKAMVHKLPETSLENFYINRFGRPLYEMFFEDYTEKVWGRHPSEISADWGAQRVKGLSLLKTVFNALSRPFRGSRTAETSLIEQFQYPKKGPGQYWELLADKIIRAGGEIHFNQRVDKIEVADNKIVSVQTNLTDTANGKHKSDRWTGDWFFSSMPVKDLTRAMGSIVPESIEEISAKLPYRDFMTVGLLAKELKLKNTTGKKTLNGGVPDCWIYIQEADVTIGRLQIFNNWSPYMTADPGGTVWIGLEYFCSEGDEKWQMSDQDFIQFAIEELVRIDIIEADDVLDACRIRVKKAYPAYFGSYESFDLVRKWLDRIDNLYCIGRNGQHRYNNMDHSMLTAITAVESIKGKADKSAVWAVNTEQDFHEIKKP
jgi:protoporphyrinogen oxidase